MKKGKNVLGVAIIIAAVIVVSVNSLKKKSPVFEANVEALADEEGGTVVYYACKILGCCGGDNKCFTGSFSYGEISVEGTFYMK